MEMTAIGRQLFKSGDSPCLNNRVTLAHFQSTENMPDIKDLLNRSLNGPEIISAHSRINLAEIKINQLLALQLSALEYCQPSTSNALIVDHLRSRLVYRLYTHTVSTF